MVRVQTTFSPLNSDWVHTNPHTGTIEADSLSTTLVTTSPGCSFDVTTIGLGCASVINSWWIRNTSWNLKMFEILFHSSINSILWLKVYQKNTQKNKGTKKRTKIFKKNQIWSF